MSKRVSLFLGAGASAIFGFPTTKTFIGDLKGSLGNTFESELLNNILSLDGFSDAEHVLQLLNDLEHFQRNPAQTFFKKYHGTVQVPIRGNISILEALGAMSRLRTKLLNDIYRQYEFNENKIFNICQVYVPFLDNLFSLNQSNKLSVFTTNYDRIIEKLCYRENISVIDGFVKNEETQRYGLNPEEYVWEPTEFRNPSSFESQNGEKRINLFKLHGSLNWRIKFDDRIVRIASEEKATSKNYKDNLVIYPSEKVKPEIDPFKTLHNEFQLELKECDAMIFIGFAFRDEYINDIIKESNTKVIVISPHASERIKNPSEGASKFRRISAINASFGATEVTEINKEIQKIVNSIRKLDKMFA